ncbi:MAG: hypothetical protein NTZ41_09400 [Sphingobacteriales bacterium]|jgi:hypothetical protein|nr:hypothetical protein [Sphingobacteriales bacterium]
MYKLLMLLIGITFLSCKSDEKTKPVTALDTGRAFIRASLDGDFKTAGSFLLKDDENAQEFTAYEQYYNRMPEVHKKEYKESSYEINKYTDINDSTTIINYSNSYMKKPMEIKVVRNAGVWLIDFKYTFSGNLPIN